MKMTQFSLIAVLLVVSTVHSLDNGLAKTPPMGWSTWERFRCVTDCKNFPDTCISEKLVMQQADKMVSEGYLQAGYKYIILDRCWFDKTRAKDGRLRPDPARFPHGIKALAAYVHSKGLKFGIYANLGAKTCEGYPGSEFYMQLDANTFAEWGVDYVHFDKCNTGTDVRLQNEGYPVFGKFLNMTGRPMVYSCTWPQLQRNPDYALISKTCNIWTSYFGMQDSWADVWGTVEFFGRNQFNVSSYAKPGAWNDAGMLIIGDYGLSQDQERSQMALWSIMAAPLTMSNDLRNTRKTSKALLQNKFAIAINQDPLGIQGNRIKKEGFIEWWTRPLTPKGSYAVAILNKDSEGKPTRVTTKLSDITGKTKSVYTIVEVFENKNLGTFNNTFVCDVNPTGICFVKLIPRSKTNLFFKAWKLVAAMEKADDDKM